MALRSEPIEVFNRYTGTTEIEAIYGERWLRWSYERGVGRLSLHLLIKRVWFSRWYGWRMSRPASAARVKPFVRRYGLDPAEFIEPSGGFASFNDFFSRQLRPGVRPVAGGEDVLVFPADGRHLGFARIDATDRVYAKGQTMDLETLLDDPALARRFAGGAMVISRLCPVDYHRFHFPCSGQFSGGRLVKGPLFSVSPIALRRSLDPLVSNKRVVSLIEETPCGAVAMVEIGATCVGTIVHTADPGRIAKGAEKGYFRFGGSCVITVFEPGRVQLAADLLAQSGQGRELYARVGDAMGSVIPARA